MVPGGLAAKIPCWKPPHTACMVQKSQQQPLGMSKNTVNYFTSSDPHHDMLGGGCQVRVVIENMMGRMENLRTLKSGFLGLVILVRCSFLELLRQAAASIGLMSA